MRILSYKSMLKNINLLSSLNHKYYEEGKIKQLI